MKHLLLLLFMALASFSGMALEGSWRGMLDLGRVQMALVLNFSHDAQGNAVCTFDSPDQGVYGLATKVCLLTDDSVAVEVTIARIKVSGRIVGHKIEGMFEQSSVRLPLVLEYQQPEATEDLPYAVSEVEIASDGAMLSGTLCMPAEPCALVVMVTGSGPQNRDEELMGHRPFAVLADSLARAGIASIRYDDRGVAQSTGDFAAATTDTFALDAQRVVEHARTIFCRQSRHHRPQRRRIHRLPTRRRRRGGLCRINSRSGYPLPRDYTRPKSLLARKSRLERGTNYHGLSHCE